MTSNAPNMLYCVGAQKAGTSWLHDHFVSHPDVHVPAVKEMHYFDALCGPERHVASVRRAKQLSAGFRARLQAEPPRREDGPIPYPSLEYSAALVAMHTDRSPRHDGYRRMMRDGWSGQAYAADITPSYCMVGAEGFREMLQVAPDAKFLFILRDPLARLISAIRMLHGDNPSATDKPIDAICHSYLDGSMRGAERRSAYADTMQALEAAVPRAQIFYLFYETLFTEATIRRLSDWLGVRYHPAEFEKVVWGGQGRAKPSEHMVERLRLKLRGEYDAMRAKFGADLPEGWKSPEQRSTA